MQKLHQDSQLCRTPSAAAYAYVTLYLQASRTRKQAAAKPRRAPKRPAGLVNLKGLIDEGLMQPGDDVLTVEYKGTITYASLTHDGRIRWKGVHKFFEISAATKAVFWHCD